jgi:hypothetical protein
MYQSAAWESMKRVRDLLGVAYLAAKSIDVDPCRGFAEQFATLIDIIEDEVDDAITFMPDELKAPRGQTRR